MARFKFWLVGGRAVHIPRSEASLRPTTVDAAAFARLQHLPNDADPTQVLEDLKLVTSVVKRTP